MRLLTSLTAAVVLLTATPAAGAPRPKAANGKFCTMVGTARNDKLVGRNGNDVICGMGGDDQLSGGIGLDFLDGGPGNDTMLGGPQADGFAGGSGVDVVSYTDHTTAGVTVTVDGRTASGWRGENDKVPTDVENVVGTRLNDVLTGSPGRNWLLGGLGNDRLVGGDGADTLDGVTGVDELIGGPGDDTLNGGDGNDTLTGNQGEDTASGGAGNDNVAGNEGDDELSGDIGNDTLTGAAGTDVLNGNAGNDTLSGGDGDDGIGAGTGDDSAAGGAGNDTINGADGDDTLNGDAGDDTIAGAGGDDTLDGADGDDTLNGEAGDDDLQGGDGDDHIDGGDGADVFDGGTGVNTCVIAEGDISAMDVCSDLGQPVADTASLEWSATSLDNAEERTVSLDVHLTDDRSGVNWGIIYVRAPGGPENSLELQGTRISGTAYDGVWRFTGTLAAGATTGDWRFAQLHISDRAGHHTQYWAADDGSYTTNLDGADGGALDLPPLAVTGEDSDDESPVVDLDSIRWTTETTLDNTSDQTVGIDVHVTDAGTGLGNVVASIRPVDRSGYLAMFDKELISGTEKDGVWRITTTLPAGATTGGWHLRWLSATDKIGHTVEYQSFLDDSVFVVDNDESTTVPHPLQDLEVTGTTSDVEPPAVDLDSLEFLPDSVPNDADRDIRVRIHLTDDVTGLNPFINMGLIGPGGATLQLYNQGLISGTETDGVFDMWGNLPMHAPAGEWRVNHIHVSDRNGHESNNNFDGSQGLPFLTVVAP